MDGSKRMSLDQIRAFLAGVAPVAFAAQGQREAYGCVGRVLVGHEYARQGKAGKGVPRRSMEKPTGLGRAPVTRSIAAYMAPAAASTA
jgi:hypothetical protein